MELYLNNCNIVERRLQKERVESKGISMFNIMKIPFYYLKEI